MKFCQICGAQLQDEDVFCSKCGANLTPKTEQPVAQTYQQPVVQNYQQMATSYNKKVCPACGNECLEQAIMCVKCGYCFPGGVSAYPKKISKPAKSKEEKRAGVAKGVAIAMNAFLSVDYIILILVNVLNNNEFSISKPILYVVFGILVIVGLAIGKSNKIISIIHIAYFPVVWLINFATTESVENLITFTGIIDFISYIFLALLFLLKNEKFKKLYFVPCILELLSYIIRAVQTLDIGEEISMSEYIGYFIGWGIGLLLGLTIDFCLGYVAKVKWNVVAPKGENTPVNATNNYVRVAQNVPNMQYQQPNNMNAVNYQNPPVYQNPQNNINYPNTQNYQNQ